jgi:hypothetical protein
MVDKRFDFEVFFRDSIESHRRAGKRRIAGAKKTWIVGILETDAMRGGVVRRNLIGRSNEIL